MSISSSRPILTLVLLACVTLAVDRAFYLAGHVAVTKSNDRFSRLYFGDLDAQIAIFGNSRAKHSLHAPTLALETGMPTVSLAKNGTDLATTAQLAKDAAQRMPSLRIAVVEVSSVFSRGQGAADLRPYFESATFLSRGSSSKKSMVPWSRIFLSTRLGGDAFLRILVNTWRDDQAHIAMAQGVSEEAMRAFRQRWRGTLALPDDAADILQDLQKALAENGIETLFVAVPDHPSLRNAARADDWVQELENRSGVPILDLRSATDDPRAFSDPLHGNLRQARLLAPIVADAIKIWMAQ